MPCPEDLIMQQYVMNELLSEQLDGESSVRFSNYIPAVRYYRGENTLRTTGESPGAEETETLSFAYQIDMDAVELRAPRKTAGCFDPTSSVGRVLFRLCYLKAEIWITSIWSALT